VPRPKRSYVYVIHVDGVLRYIGKGSNGRMYAHMKEVKHRLTRKFDLKNVSPLFQRKLTEAVMQGAVVEEIVLADNLTSKRAYKLEYRHLEKMVYAGKRHLPQRDERTRRALTLLLKLGPAIAVTIGEGKPEVEAVYRRAHDLGQ
jgi:hypothetical protein